LSVISKFERFGEYYTREHSSKQEAMINAYLEFVLTAAYPQIIIDGEKKYYSDDILEYWKNNDFDDRFGPIRR